MLTALADLVVLWDTIRFSITRETSVQSVTTRLSPRCMTRAMFLTILGFGAIAAPADAQNMDKEKVQKYKVLSPPTVLNVKATSAIACSTLVQDHLAWINQNRGQSEGSHVVGAKMATVKITRTDPNAYPWGHGSYSEGRVGWGGDELTGRFKVVFSDRKSSDGKYRFNPDKADLQDLTLFSDGRVRIVLQSWGSATLFLQDVQCYAGGFITGIKNEGNGTSLVSIAISKETIRSGDGFRDWP